MGYYDWGTLTSFLGKVGTVKEKVGILKLMAGVPVASVTASSLVNLGYLAFNIGFWPTLYLKEKYLASLTISSLPSKPTFYGGTFPKKVIIKTPGETIYPGSKPGETPHYHFWSGQFGVQQAAYLSAVPNGDKVIWPYTKNGYIGHTYHFRSPWFSSPNYILPGGRPVLTTSGLETRLLIKVAFRASFPEQWTDLGLKWDPSMSDAPHIPGEVVWKYDGYGWLYRSSVWSPDRWYDGGINDAIRTPSLGIVPHVLAQRGTMVTPSGDISPTFSRVPGGLALVVGGDSVLSQTWDSSQLKAFAYDRTNGASADPYVGIDLVKKDLAKASSVEFIVWEPAPKPEEEKVSSTPPKIKTKKMDPCCPKILKKLAKMEKDLTKYLYHDLSGHFPPICVEAGTKNPVGDPIVDWGNEGAVKALVAATSAGKLTEQVPEIYKGSGISGLAAMLISLSFQLANTGLGTDRGKALLCQAEEPKIVVSVIGSGFEGIFSVDLPNDVLYVIVKITEYKQGALRRFYLEGDYLSPPFPVRGWFGFVSFLDDQYLSSQEIPLNASKNKFSLPFKSKRAVFRLEPFVVAEISVVKVESP